MDFNKQIHHQIEKKVTTLFEQATIIFPQFQIPNYQISYRMWSKRTAGMVKIIRRPNAASTTFIIKLNPVFFHHLDFSEYEHTIVHEVAHVIDYSRYGHTGHSASWKQIMNNLGYQGNRCHTYQLPNHLKSKSNTRTVYCDCKTHDIGIIRFNRIKKGTHQYVCKYCRTPIRMKEYEKIRL